MEQHKSSNRPTIELNHEHITTLRSVNEAAAIDRELAPIHDQYLAGEYRTTEFGHALVDDLTLSASQIAHLDRQLRANVSELPIDVIQHLTGELDTYHQIKYRQPASPPTLGDDGDDDDIIVADGGRDLTREELARLYHDEYTQGHLDDRIDDAVECVWDDWHDENFSGVVMLESAGWNPGMLRIEVEVHPDTRKRDFCVKPSLIRLSDPEMDVMEDFATDVIEEVVARGEPEDHDVITDGGVTESTGDAWRCPFCEETSHSPESSRPIKGRQCMKMRITCPHCSKTTVQEWR